ncbi:MAPEG family protein [Aurantiacibacter gangjinensis]|uniref:Membrane protein n=1 Tax=Aurantiacibacter gangjinensis TaxID=502682 RepID=A0A0G9MT13_9SPHN|nr:MAPEG family protein [Aurantiacibacter gangjinensis]APE28967.1 hypothetical protein BMF35_a2138 [Aurantiacibacter gangjinensis]KLE33654.1 membrane protein [Aurantiacibacter gangjinensis]
MLQPVIALAAWTFVMWLWMYATRLPAMKAHSVDPDDLAKDPTMSLDAALPPHVQWKAKNYNHLHEAPTVFYAVAISLAVVGETGFAAVALAWAYVAFRIAHSLAQATVPKVVLRFLLFTGSQLCLLALVVIAAVRILAN